MEKKANEIKSREKEYLLDLYKDFPLPSSQRSKTVFVAELTLCYIHEENTKLMKRHRNNSGRTLYKLNMDYRQKWKLFYFFERLNAQKKPTFLENI